MRHNPTLHLGNCAQLLSYNLLPIHLSLFCQSQELLGLWLIAAVVFIATAEAGNIFKAATPAGTWGAM